jgi:HTH-type transcriptional regulator, glycine betaine synthesis regulator
MATSEDPVASSILRVADTVGAIIEFWGFKRAMGRIWGLLYLNQQPLTSPEIGEALHMSAGAVSMTLQELTKWGVVKKSWVPGDRKDYYEPETSIWKMVSRVFRERELAQIRSAIETFQEAAEQLGKTKSDRRRAKFIGERLEALLNLARVGESLLAAILEGKKIDPTPIMTFLRS